MNISSLTKATLVSLLALGAIGAADAQTLTLSPAVNTVTAGTTAILYTVTLTGDVTPTSGYYLNVYLPAQLSYDTAASNFFTNLDPTNFGSPSFPTPFMIQNGSATNGQAGINNDLVVALGNNSTTGLTPPPSDSLFSFLVNVNSAIPLGGVQITFGTANVSGARGGTQFATTSGTTIPVTVAPARLVGPLAAVPEASPVALLGLGLLPLGLLAARRRRA